MQVRHMEFAELFEYSLILHDFRYEGGAPINSGFQIPSVNEKREYGSGFKSSDPLIPANKTRAE